jgi:hypothetical protein
VLVVVVLVLLCRDENSEMRKCPLKKGLKDNLAPRGALSAPRNHVGSP